MRALLTMVGMAFALSTCAPAYAQRPPGAPPPGEGPNCMDLGTVKSDAQWAKIMQDNEGDWWILLRFTSTGRQLIGFLSHATGKFCVTGEGRTNPES